MENLSHSRPPAKLSSTSAAKRGCNGGKNSYDDFFGGPPKFGAPSLSPRPEDYSEIFGGFHAARATSIPVLDLPVVEDEVVCFDVRRSGFDYGEVFGGFDGLDFPASVEELMRHANGGGDHDRDGDSSDEAWTPAGSECLSDESDLPGLDQYSLNGDTYEQINSSMKFNISYHKTDKGRNQDMYEGVTRMAELHTLPEYGHVFEETIPPEKAHDQNPDLHVTNGDVNLKFPARRKRKKHFSKRSNLRNGAVDEAMTAESLDSQSGYTRAESCSDRGFVSISEISLRTQPSDVPPPTRRPPTLDLNKGDCRDGQNTDSDKRAGGDSPPYFDVEIDASSAAAASAAAIKEAMENAQAKFRSTSTKDLMQRKSDGVQAHKVLPPKHDRMDKTEKVKNATDKSCDMDYKLLQRAWEKGKSQEKISVNDGGMVTTTKMLPGSIEGEKHFNVSKKCMEDKHAGKLQSSRGLCDIGVADEWHEAAQFFELVRTENLASDQVREESLLLQNPKIHEPQQKAEKVATQALKQQREIGEEVTTVRLDHDLEKIESDLRLAKEAFWRPETNGRSEVEKQAVRVKVNEKKLGVLQDSSKLEENSTKSIATQHLSERGKRIAEANEAEKRVRTEIRLADSELEIEQVRTYTTCDVPKFQQKHGKLGEIPERGYERKLVVDFEQSADDKMLKKSLEQEEKERKLKEVRRREERKKKEKEDREREEKVQKERQAHFQEEEKKRREAREREEKEKIEVEIREREKVKKEQELQEAKQKEERELQIREEQEKKENAARREEEEKRKRDALVREEQERKEMEASKMEEERRVREALIQQEQNVKVTEAYKGEEDDMRKREVLKREEQESKIREVSKREEVGKKVRERLEGEENERKLREASEKAENARKEKEWRELEEEMIWKMALEQLENEKVVKQTFWPSENEEKTRKNPEEEVLEKVLNQAHKIEEKDRIQTADLLKNGKPCEGKVFVTEIRGRQDHEKESNSEFEETFGKDGIGRINTEFQRKEETLNLGVIDDEHVRGKEALDEGEKKLEDATIYEAMGEVKGEDDSNCSSQREQIGKKIETAECNGDWGLEEKCLNVPDGAVGQDTYTKVLDDAKSHCETKTRTKFVGDEASKNQRNSEEIMSISRVGCNPENKRSKFTNEHSGADMDATSNHLQKSDNRVSRQALKESIEAGKKAEAAQSFHSEGKTNTQKVSQQVKTNQATEKKDNNIREIRAAGQAARIQKEREMEMERLKKMEEAREREREREKDRMAVDKVTLEARDKAYAESRGRTERTAVDRATPEARNRTLSEARERLEKACSGARDKSYTEAKFRADRTAVDRPTADARERAMGKAMAERASADTNERMGRSLSDMYSSSRNSEMRDIKDRQFQRAETFSGSRFPVSSSYSGVEVESAQRCKARLDRCRRTAERAAKALEEKNMRDILAQKEQAERHRLAETLGADVKRWSSGKEGNLRALLSTLQYILGADSGWQPIPLTEVITSAGVKRAYRKATLCVHPDKLQQRGASIQQKYICEKVFDLLKEAWNKFSSEER